MNLPTTWYSVRIPPRGAGIFSAWTLITKLRAQYEKAGAPTSVVVYHDFTEGGSNLFHFTPMCATVFPQLLKIFEALPSDEPPILEKLTRVLAPIPPPAENW